MRIPTLLQGQPLRLALLLLLCFAAFSLFYLSSGIRPTTVADVFSALSGGARPMPSSSKPSGYRASLRQSLRA